jgi:hypothetical protein
MGHGALPPVLRRECYRTLSHRRLDKAAADDCFYMGTPEGKIDSQKTYSGELGHFAPQTRTIGSELGQHPRLAPATVGAVFICAKQRKDPNRGEYGWGLSPGHLVQLGDIRRDSSGLLSQQLCRRLSVEPKLEMNVRHSSRAISGHFGPGRFTRSGLFLFAQKQQKDPNREEQRSGSLSRGSSGAAVRLSGGVDGACKAYDI